MVKYMSYETISAVVETWDIAKNRFSCEDELGILILRRLLESDSSIKTIFGFTQEQEIHMISSDDPKLRTHGSIIVKMLDMSWSLLGPDSETLEAILEQEGERHSRIGVKAKHFPLLRNALCDTLSEIIGSNKWNNEIKAAYIEVFDELSNVILRSMPQR